MKKGGMTDDDDDDVVTSVCFILNCSHMSSQGSQDRLRK